MRILIYSDNHFCTSSSIINGMQGEFSYRLTNQIESLSWLEKLSKDCKCNLEICCGDFFDKESLTSQELSALRKIPWNNTKKEFIVGNHEMGNNDLTYNSLNALAAIGNVCNKPTLIHDNYCNIILIPYILETDRKELTYYLDYAVENSGEIFDENLPTIIFMHNDIKGIQYGGFLSKAGFDLEDIKSHCSLCFNGHLHNQAIVDNKIYLVGNCTGLNFSEDARKYKHYAYILDTETLKVVEYENPYAFNFYKLDYPFDKYILSGNSIVSLKVKQSDLDEAKEKLYNNKNIIKSRITIIPELSIESSDVSEIIAKDHIQQFKDFALENLGCDEIIKEELRRL